MEDVRSAFKILTSKHTGKRPPGRSRRRWEHNTKIDLESAGFNSRHPVHTYS